MTKVLVKSSSTLQTEEDNEEITKEHTSESNQITPISSQTSGQGMRWNLDNLENGIPYDKGWNIPKYKFGNVMTHNDPSFPKYKGGYKGVEQTESADNYVEQERKEPRHRTINTRFGNMSQYMKERNESTELIFVTIL